MHATGNTILLSIPIARRDEYHIRQSDIQINEGPHHDNHLIVSTRAIEKLDCMRDER
jgi:hypothetical protein